MMDTPIISDVKLWHAIALCLLAVLIWVIKWYFSRLETILTYLQQSVAELISISKLHEHKIRDNQEEIAELKKRKRSP